LPVVGHPDVAGRIDADVHLQLQPATDIAARRRNSVACFQAAALGIAEFVCAPDVAQTVECKAASREAGLEGLGLGRIAGRKAVT
jgi:hypothetical protein